MVDKGEYIAMLNVGTNVLFDVEVIWISVGVKFVFYMNGFDVDLSLRNCSELSVVRS